MLQDCYAKILLKEFWMLYRTSIVTPLTSYNKYVGRDAEEPVHLIYQILRFIYFSYTIKYSNCHNRYLKIYGNTIKYSFKKEKISVT